MAMLGGGACMPIQHDTKPRAYVETAEEGMELASVMFQDLLEKPRVESLDDCPQLKWNDTSWGGGAHGSWYGSSHLGLEKGLGGWFVKWHPDYDRWSVYSAPGDWYGALAWADTPEEGKEIAQVLFRELWDARKRGVAEAALGVVNELLG